MNHGEWEKFAVDRSSLAKGRTESNLCRPLTTVSHVAHVPTALRIVEDRELRAGLINDKSKLNNQRIRVVWLSPNDWTNNGGFRYGNVRFTYDWRRLIEGQKFYWVESIAYNTAACRILVTQESHGALDAYDPEQGNGPWYYDRKNDKHYWNGLYCLEIMFEKHVKLSDAIGVDFVSHKSDQCCIDVKTCQYLDMSRHYGAAEFIATLVSRGTFKPFPGMIEIVGGMDTVPSAIVDAIETLLQRCGRLKPDSWGTMTSSDASALALARALLGKIARKKPDDDAVKLAALYRSSEEVEKSVKKALEWAFEPNEGQLLLP